MKTRSTNKVKALGVVLAAAVVVLSPVAASAANTNGDTDISVTISDGISLTTSETVAFSLVPTADGVVSSGMDTVTVNTNVDAGYTLTMTDSDTTTTLADGSDSFAATSNTTAAPGVLANGEWGFAVAGNTGFDGSYTTETNNTSSTSKWAAVPASDGTPYQIKTTASPALDDESDVWFAAKANTSQAPGTYTGTVTYTAVTN